MPAATTSNGSALASGQPECTKCRIVSAAAASAPETKTALMPIRNLREPARRRALPIRGDIGNSARTLMTRMRDYFRVEAGTWTRNELSSAGGTSVLGLTIIVAQGLQPCDQADPPPEDLVRPGVIANVVGLPGAVGEEGDAFVT